MHPVRIAHNYPVSKNGPINREQAEYQQIKLKTELSVNQIEEEIIYCWDTGANCDDCVVRCE